MAFEERCVWRSLEDCSSQEPSVKYLYVPGIFLKPLCVSIRLKSLSISEVVPFLSEARRGAGQRKERSCDHRVSSRINYSVSVYSAWIRALGPWGLGQATGKVTRRHQGNAGRWQKLSARAKCWEPSSIQPGMWNVEMVTREVWLILLNEISFARECLASVPTEY